jgi:hypothetical protein
MTTEIREHEYVILSRSDDPPREIARLWWDGTQVQCDPPRYLARIDRMTIVGVPSDAPDGIAFLETLPLRYRNGYITCHRVR